MEENKFDIKKEVFDFVKLLVFWFLVFMVLTKFVVNPVQVIGSSMYPTLKDKERGFSSIISKNFEIHRLDIVVVDAKDNSGDHWVKRVIGLPYETIECRDDIIYINGEALSEDFLDEKYVNSEREIYGRLTDDFGPITLGENEYFLMGDNRQHSTDSRAVGPFNKDDITSVGIFVYFPFSEFGGK